MGEYELLKKKESQKEKEITRAPPKHERGNIAKAPLKFVKQ